MQTAPAPILPLAARIRCKSSAGAHIFGSKQSTGVEVQAAVQRRIFWPKTIENSTLEKNNWEQGPPHTIMNSGGGSKPGGIECGQASKYIVLTSFCTDQSNYAVQHCGVVKCLLTPTSKNSRCLKPRGLKSQRVQTTIQAIVPSVAPSAPLNMSSNCLHCTAC